MDATVSPQHVGYPADTRLLAEARQLVGYYFQWQKERLIRLGFGYTVRTDAVSQALGNTFELNATYSWGESGLVRCPVW